MTKATPNTEVATPLIKEQRWQLYCLLPHVCLDNICTLPQQTSNAPSLRSYIFVHEVYFRKNIKKIAEQEAAAAVELTKNAAMLRLHHFFVRLPNGVQCHAYIRFETVTVPGINSQKKEKPQQQQQVQSDQLEWLSEYAKQQEPLSTCALQYLPLSTTRLAAPPPQCWHPAAVKWACNSFAVWNGC